MITTTNLSARPRHPHSDRLRRSRSIRSSVTLRRNSASSARSSMLRSVPCWRAARSRVTQLPSVPSLTPDERATSAAGRPSSRTIATASAWNSGGYFAGQRGRRFFGVDMDFLLYEMSGPRGDAQFVVLRFMSPPESATARQTTCTKNLRAPLCRCHPIGRTYRSAAHSRSNVPAP